MTSNNLRGIPPDYLRTDDGDSWCDVKDGCVGCWGKGGGAGEVLRWIISLLLRRRRGAIDILMEIHRHDYQALRDDGRT